MKIASFDIFDTCLVRKCGTPQNMLDVLSLRAFKTPVSECTRQEFVAIRRKAEDALWDNRFAKLADIYNNIPQFRPELKTKEELIMIELELERSLLVPVLSIREEIDRLRDKGNHIIFISDMYLPSIFLKDILINYGFFKKGDSVYVSSECGAVKWDGSLYQYVAKKENLKYKHWQHFGDNKISDYKEAKKLGIKAHLINHQYNYYPQCWIDKNCGVQYKVSNIVAGLCRSITLSNEQNSQLNFIVDIILPYSVSLVNKWMQQAVKDGISKLYFCSRDTYHLYHIAELLSEYYPTLECRYLYISRKALLEGNEEAFMLYLMQEGLASKEGRSAIVDVRSSGQTQFEINEKLKRYNFKSIKGYYFEMFAKNKLEYFNDYYAVVNRLYVKHNNNNTRLLEGWQLYEDYFFMNTELKTVDYRVENGKAIPVKSEIDDNDNSYLVNSEFYQDVYNKLLAQFTTSYIELGLIRNSNEILDLSIYTLARFFSKPNKTYLKALEEFYAYSYDHSQYVSFVGNISLFKLIMTKGRTNVWRRGTITNSSPQWLLNLLWFLKK